MMQVHNFGTVVFAILILFNSWNRPSVDAFVVLPKTTATIRRTSASGATDTSTFQSSPSSSFEDDDVSPSIHQTKDTVVTAPASPETAMEQLRSDLRYALDTMCYDDRTYEKLSDIMDQTCPTNNSTAPTPTILLNQLLKALHHSPDPQAPFIADQLFESSSLLPDKYSYFLLLRNWSERGNPHRCEEILNDMWHQSSHNPDLKPTKFVYAPVLKSWSNDPQRNRKHPSHPNPHPPSFRPRPDAVDRVLRLLDEMWEHSTTDSALKPDIVSYATALPALARAGHKSAALEASRLLQTMHQHPQLQPNVMIYNLVLQAWTGFIEGDEEEGVAVSRNATEESSKSIVEHVGALLEDMLVTRGIHPDGRTFYHAIQAWYWNDPLNVHKRALQLLHFAMSHGVKPSIDMYEQVMMTWLQAAEANSSNKRNPQYSRKKQKTQQNNNDNLHHAVHAVMILFADLQWRCQHGQDGSADRLRPTRRTYLIVLRALEKGRTIESGIKAKAILSDLWHQYEQQQQSSSSSSFGLKPPDALMYSHVMSAVANSGVRDAGAQTEELLRDLWRRHSNRQRKTPTPTNRMYHTVMKAWAKQRTVKGALRATRLLEEVWELYEEDRKRRSRGRGRRRRARGRVESGHSRRGNTEYRDQWSSQGTTDDRLKPNLYLYTACIDAWANAQHPMAAPKVMDLLEDLWERYRHEGHDGLKPNTVVLNACLNALAKSHAADAPQLCQNLLRDMWEQYGQEDDRNKRKGGGPSSLKPDDITYATVCAALARGRTAAGPQALELLEEQKSHPGLPPPSVITYNSVLFALSRSGMVDEARRLLEQEMVGSEHCRPDLTSYHTVMNGLALDGRFEQVEEILRELTRLSSPSSSSSSSPSRQSNMFHLRPTRQTYETLLNAWACSSGRSDCGVRANSLLQKMWQQKSSRMKPKLYTYKLVIKAWLRQLERDEEQGNEEKSSVTRKGLQDLFVDLERRYTKGDADLAPDGKIKEYQSQYGFSKPGSQQNSSETKHVPDVPSHHKRRTVSPSTLQYNSSMKRGRQTKPAEHSRRAPPAAATT